jgi:16S rRNA U516 pseudouridylate synthase RsuA-like enzyme
MTLSNRMKPFMAYLEETKYVQLKRFSKHSKIPMSQLVREAIEPPSLSPGDKYHVTGFNDEALGCNEGSL